MNKAERFQQLTCTQAIRNDLRASSIRAAAYVWVAGAIDFVLRIGSTAILARLILPEHFGLVMMVMAVTAIADQFKDLGLSSATVQKENISHEEVTNLFWINVLAGVLISLVVCASSSLIAAYYKEPRLTIITCVLATNFVIGGLMVQHQALLTRQLKLGATSTIRLVSNTTSTLLAIVLAWKGYGYWALVWREVSRSVLLTAGMWLCIPWVPSLPRKEISVRGLIRFGTDMSAAYIIGSICNCVDRILIGRFWGPTPVAMNRQAYQLIVLPMEQLFSPINQVAHPGLSLLQSDEARFRQFYQKMTSAICIATMPLSLYVAAYSSDITLFVLGQKWSDSAPILMILAFGAFIKWTVMPSGLVLISRGRSRIFFVLHTVGNVAVVVFMVIGVHWGAQGVAVADVAATYLLIAPKLYFSFRNSPVTVGIFLGTIARPAIASVLMAVVLFSLRPLVPHLALVTSLTLGGLVGLLVFLAAVLLMPGGQAELSGLVSDLHSTLQRRGASAKGDVSFAVSDQFKCVVE